MRTSILLARKHGETEFVLLAGPETPLHEQREMLSGLLVANKVHDDFSEVQYWESDDGCQRILKFEPTKVFEARQAKIKADHAAYEESQKRKGKGKAAPAKSEQKDEPKKTVADKSGQPDGDKAEQTADL